MAAILTRRRLRFQPRGPVEIDWGNSLTNGLVFAYPGSDRISVAAQGLETLAPTGTPVRADNAALGYITDKFGGADYLKLGRAAATAVPVSMSVFCQVGASATSINCLISIADNSDHLFRIYWWDGSGTKIWAQTSDTVVSPQASCATSLPAGSSFHGGARFYGASSRAVYVNGRNDGSELATSCSTSVTNAVPTTTVGAYVGGIVSYQFNGSIGPASIWNTDIGDAGMAEHYANPWQLFKPRMRRLYFGVTGAGGPIDVPANLSLPTLGTGIYQPIMSGFAS